MTTSAVKIAAIIAAAAIICTALVVYFSPFQTCMRAPSNEGEALHALRCASAAKH